MDKIDILNRTQTIFADLSARFAYWYLESRKEKNPEYKDIYADEILEKLSFPLIVSVFIMNKAINIVNSEKEHKQYTEEEYAIFVEDIEREFLIYYDSFMQEESVLKSNEVH